MCRAQLIGVPGEKIAPPTILSKSVYIAKPIATKSRPHKPQDFAFMESDSNRMLTEAIIQVSTSPWRAQAFVVRDGHKSRMVIDYSQTIIRHSSKDAFAFPNMQDLFEKAAETTVFSKIDFEVCVSSNLSQSHGHIIHHVRSKWTTF